MTLSRTGWSLVLAAVVITGITGSLALGVLLHSLWLSAVMILIFAIGFGAWEYSIVPFSEVMSQPRGSGVLLDALTGEDTEERSAAQLADELGHEPSSSEVGEK